MERFVQEEFTSTEIDIKRRGRRRGCQGNKEGHVQSWSVCGASIEIFFLHAEKDQEWEASRRGRCSSEGGLCMYAEMKLVGGGVLGGLARHV